MKTKKLSNKLVLKKETIATLGPDDLGKARGGRPRTLPFDCNSGRCTEPDGCNSFEFFCTLYPAGCGF